MADALLGGIIINEILVDPNGSPYNFDTDGSGTAADTDEYVELYNSSNAAIDISGLQLWDAGVGRWFTFPAGTILAAGGHALVMSGVQPGGTLPTGAPGDLFFSAGRSTPLINNPGDNVVVYDPAHNSYIQATFNGDPLDNPTLGGGGYTGFSSTATRIGTGENFGADTDGQSLQRDGDGNNTVISATPTPGTTNICFANGTRLATPDGERPVEDLAVGDLVLTADRGARPIVWILARSWSAEDVARTPGLAAVRVGKDALAPGLPSRDLRLSQQHRVLARGRVAERMFGAAEVLVPAKALLGLPGVTLDEGGEGVTYFHIMLAEHEIVFSDGLPTESLYLGAEALEALPQAARDELHAIFGPSLQAQEGAAGPVLPARTFVTGRRAARMVARLTRNRHPLIDPRG